jgi:hypothetical protein
MTVGEHPLQKDNYNDPSSDQPWFDNTCICKMCDHDLARDCLKAKCTCCKEHDHSMVLDGIQGFPPTADNNKPA